MTVPRWAVAGGVLLVVVVIAAVVVLVLAGEDAAIIVELVGVLIAGALSVGAAAVAGGRHE